MHSPVDLPLQSMNRNGRGVEFDFPDEIAIEILSRLPAVDVVRLRSVCKRWRDLTASRHFTGLHLQHAMVLFQVFYFHHVDDIWRDVQLSFPLARLDHYWFDHWWKPLQKKPDSYKFSESSEFEILFSHGGLIVMKHRLSSIYRIMNPMYHVNVQITISQGLRTDDLCGVFFHPLLKEYCTLWMIFVSEDVTETERPEYKILNLGSKPCWRVINNPWSHMARVTRIPPILIDEHLHWVVKDGPESPDSESSSFLDIIKNDISFCPDIMEFDVRKEEFSFISSPVSGPYGCNKWNINLLDIGGHLSLVRTSPFEHSPSNKPFEVNIWMLKDRTKQLWTFSSYSINTNVCFSDCWPIALVNDELVFRYCGVMFNCNLKLCVVRESEFEIDGSGAAISTTHVMSLASLRNCKSEIYMDKRGEVEKNGKRKRCNMSDGDDENPVTISKTGESRGGGGLACQME